jgi:predicted ATP-dependent serine protease
MKEPKLKTVYVCTNCGESSPRWMGRCPSCGSWNTMNEDIVAEQPKAGVSGAKSASVRQEGVTSLTARKLMDISTTEEKSRIVTGISELDRVLGGGIVLGGVVLLSGEPGVGKSTMLLQLCGAISNQHTVLYITGEESVRQVKLRATRLNIPQENIYLKRKTGTGRDRLHPNHALRRYFVLVGHSQPSERKYRAFAGGGKKQRDSNVHCRSRQQRRCDRRSQGNGAHRRYRALF